jgi:S-DNA-T family DNA segregation ATPase FtsK/SpoIIIE
VSARRKTETGHALDEILGALLALAGLLVWWLLRRPRALAVVLVLSGSVWWLGVSNTAAVALGGLVPAVVWWLVEPISFDQVIGWRLRSWWRRWWVYRRRWSTTMRLTKLAKVLDGHEVAPRLRRVRSGLIFDTVRVRMRSGQQLSDWEDQSERLANTFGALSCKVLPLSPGWLTLELKHTDLLATSVPALPIPAEPSLESVTIGWTERGEPWRLPLLGNHTLVAGRTGSGKSSSVLQSIIRGLAPLIRAGLVEVWVCDPKRGMEFAFAAPMFARFEYTTDPMIGLLADAVDGMQERGDRLRGVTRLHTPTVDDPLVLIIVDEVAALTDVLGSRRQREEAQDHLRLLMQQGRAIGYSVIAALQDPAKSGVPYRNLFTVRVALALTEPTEPDMVLGKGARDRGALCDRIPDWAKGCGYVLLDGQSDPTYVRAGYVTDDDIKAAAQLYPAPIHADAVDTTGEVIDLHPEEVLA